MLSDSKSLARALAPAVRVNILCPGWIETAFGEHADRGLPARGGRSRRRSGAGTLPTDVAVGGGLPGLAGAAFITGQAINVNGGVVM